MTPLPRVVHFEVNSPGYRRHRDTEAHRIDGAAVSAERRLQSAEQGSWRWTEVVPLKALAFAETHRFFSDEASPLKTEAALKQLEIVA